MYSALRTLKVAPPQLQLKEVQRPRLLEMLDRAVERPVTLICAGPGSGKTVLVNQWTRARPHGVIWVSLDAEDDREARFWTLVQHALHHNGLIATASWGPNPVARWPIRRRSAGRRGESGRRSLGPRPR